MRHWDLNELAVEAHRPDVLHSEGEGRAIAISLPAGESMQDHQVHERSWLVVVAGRIEVEPDEGETVTAGPGHLLVFDPNERREVRAVDESRLLLLLAPWPGQGHPSLRTA